MKLRETLRVEKGKNQIASPLGNFFSELLKSSSKAGEDINQTKFLLDREFVVYSSLTKNITDLIKNLD